ncbi:sensor domain-containing diguanylate cyclase [Vibrio aquaticus]|uniref:sensor domain-containing diguanylate cyclase n=1 Tax=Vibrio aquaticus TaxID=2496559 RepID=UPI001FC9F85C|nr:sensor domain-containing diguanylate cyclase [Vibrio aquaticus]
MKIQNLVKKWFAKLSINQMLVVSHLVLVLILISGFSYTRYHSEWNRHVEYSATIAKLTLAPHIPSISNSVADINYVKLTDADTKKVWAAVDDLEFLEVSGVADHSDQQVHVRFFKRLEYLWRADVEPQELGSLEEKLFETNLRVAQAKEQGAPTLNKLRFYQTLMQREYDSLLESRFISDNIYVPWTKPVVNQEQYYLDDETCTLNIVIPLQNKNGGELWAVFDASDLTDLQHSLVEEIIAEAIVALAISLVLIGWISHWIVSPLKSLADHMRAGTANEQIGDLEAIERGDEIGQLARAYQGLLTKIDHQLSILRKRSDTDPLTGLGSRYNYTQNALPYIRRQIAKGQYVGLIVCDVDNFKAFNDRYGHTEGDNALSLVGAKINELARDTDLAFRYGGEEFVLLCARTDLSQLVNFTERLRKEIEGLGITHEGNAPYGHVTMSIGGSVSNQKDIDEHFHTHQDLQESMFNAADKALYCSKGKGRNQVSWSGSRENSELEQPALEVTNPA